MSATRSRVLGGVALIAMFAAGFAAGVAWKSNRRGQIDVNVRMTTELPAELRRLGLSPAQEDSLRQILADGQQRMRRVLGELEPRMRGVIDSVDASIRAALTPEQRARFESARRVRRDAVEIDTVVR